jgi:hypothetical protein
MADHCACDVCDVIFGSHDARTPDGYCGFCAKSCYPPGKVGNREMRVSMTKNTRANLHAAARVGAHLPHDPHAAVTAARHEAATAVVDFLGPILQQGGRAAVEAIRKKIKGA